MPLPLAVKTPEDLAFKAAAERQYLMFNLLASGKLAWDQGDWVRAAERWEALLRIPALPADVAAIARPLAEEARKRAGGAAASLPALPVPAPMMVAPGAGTPPAQEAAPAAAASSSGASASRPRQVTVSGKVTGGGARGPGGTVVWLKRAGGATPRPKPARGKFVAQRDKQFVPRVLAVPVGTEVQFRNEDGVFHNVFSLTGDSGFDLGLYGGGGERGQVFREPGAVQLLCNIHSSMVGYVVAVDTPWFAQAREDGTFAIKGVPAGDYTVEAWHELSSETARQMLTVGDEGAQLSISVLGDKKPPTIVPDKYGRPRQPQLGY
jgi:plastocyanin